MYVYIRIQSKLLQQYIVLFSDCDLVPASKGLESRRILFKIITCHHPFCFGCGCFFLFLTVSFFPISSLVKKPLLWESSGKIGPLTGRWRWLQIGLCRVFSTWKYFGEYRNRKSTKYTYHSFMFSGFMRFVTMHCRLRLIESGDVQGIGYNSGAVMDLGFW